MEEFIQSLSGKRKTNLVKIINEMGGERVLRMSATQLDKAEKRAEKNKEDLVKKSLFTDILD